MRPMAAKILLQGSGLRATYGLLALLFPKLLFSSVGMSEEDLDQEARYFNRLFGGRDLLVAGLTVAAVRAGELRSATNINLVCEGTDTVSLLEELRSRGGLDRTLAIGLAFNVAGYATWLRAFRALGAG
jgi:hypothetical protein